MIPVDFVLHQNTPNPFNPTTQINYQLPVVGNVQLAIYNVRGQLVETLVNESQNPGYYSVSFDGSGYSSGVYFYRLSTPEFQNVKKMVLLQ
ncbi:MAG: T9SS type A sorting domain-containing protein [Candidatus Marinimicrobia bacterium]|nr:T9SS type A sorting domain-containing protein [Candidatus Neomarinimicrobiota bacterium]